MAIDWIIAGGLASGALAGAAARFGRLCTMGAIEDALIGRDFRGAKAWGVAIACAIAFTGAGSALGLVNVTGSSYRTDSLHVLGVVIGGLMFGLGMTLAGTCSFGLLVRAGGGDLRAAVTAAILGASAAAVTSGLLAPLREPLLGIGRIPLDLPLSSPLLTSIALAAGAALVLPAALDRRLWRRPRLLLSALALGLAVAIGWAATSQAVDALSLTRPETLSFVAPLARLLLQLVDRPYLSIGFGGFAALGAIAGSVAVAAWRGDIRFEAFDDAREMGRHAGGAVLMGFGGVLAQGCTIGQGVSAASVLSLSAPLFIAAVIIGARIGLWHLIDGEIKWWPGRQLRRVFRSTLM